MVRSSQGFQEIDGLKSLMSDCPEDKDMYNIAVEEVAEAVEDEQSLQHRLLKSLLPKDDADVRDCILEEASGAVSGSGAFGKLKFESGIHRRVPVTEKSGRVHTSAVSVAILPQADEVDVQLRNDDLKIDTYRSGGSGGQSVNTMSSAVRVTHIPTRITVAIQDERSQHMVRALGAVGYVLISSFLIRENILNLITINIHASLTYILMAVGVNNIPIMDVIYTIFGSLLLLNYGFFIFLLHILYAVFLSKLGMKESFNTSWMARESNLIARGYIKTQFIQLLLTGLGFMYMYST